MADSENFPLINTADITAAAIDDDVSRVANEELASTSALLSQSENSNNENREKELTESDATDLVENAQEILPEISDTNLDNRLSENPSSEGKSIDDSSATKDEDVNTPTENDYSKFVSYNKLGIAIYIDPSTKLQYEYDKEKSEWIVATEENRIETYDDDKNPYENEHYRWCHKTNQWLLKTEFGTDSQAAAAASTINENEFYKWDAVKNEWVPKTGTGSVSSEIVDGVHQYTDADGATFFWDTDKNAWFPKIDDDFMAKYQMSYGFVDNTSSGCDGGSDNVQNLNKDDCDRDKEGENDSEKSDRELAKGGKRKPEPPRKYKVYIEINLESPFL